MYGGPGGDQLYGLAGDDTYGVYSPFDTVFESPGEGNDRVLTFSSYALASGASVETLSTAINAGTDPIQLTGNELNQIIVGNNGANTIDGRGGGDPMVGLDGDDVYFASSRTDFIVEAATGGNDTVYVRGDFVLNAGSSVEMIGVADAVRYTGLLIGGNELAQTIRGYDGADTLNGGGGADTLVGGLGDDTYRLFGGETVTEIFGGGYDRVFTSASFESPQPITLPLWFSSRTRPLASEIEFISTAVNAGTEAINLVGSPIAQTIIGNYGNNILDSRGGSDTLIGLRGDDIYRVYGDYEVVFENAGEGNDTIFSSGNYVLASGVSVETLSTANNGYIPYHSPSSIDLTGNELAQTVIGDYGSNVLDGGGGNDTLIGLRGNDIFLFTTALGAGKIDTLPDFGEGADRIRLDPVVFAGLTAGPLAASAIVIGSAAADTDDRIIYNASTGALSFDSDGTGSTAAVQFGILPTGLTASQIIVDVVDKVVPSGVVTLPARGADLLVGGAIGPGIDLTSTYPNATSFRVGSDEYVLEVAPSDVIFGPNSIEVPIVFSQGRVIGAFDFSQLGTALNLTPTTDFRTAAGQTVIAYPRNPIFIDEEKPSAIIGTPFDDYIDASRRTGPPDLRFGPNLSGGYGNDTLIGGYLMDGGSGNDLLVSINNGILVGGTGGDTFRIGVNVRYVGYQRAPNTLLDFNPNEDKIELLVSREPFLSLFPAGTLSSDQLTTELKQNYGSVGTIVY